jgi:hypothetical protein
MDKQDIATDIEDDTKNEEREKSLREQAQESSVALFAFLAAVGFTLYSYLNGDFDDRTDFAFQKVLFSVWAVAAYLIGLNVGYTNPGEKRLWVFADMIWIATAVLSLGSLLNPVEEYILPGKIEVSRIAAEGHHQIITNEIVLGAKSVCSPKPLAPSCRDWQAFQAQVDAPNVPHDTLLNRLQPALQNLPSHAAYQKHRDVVVENKGLLEVAINEGARARTQLENVSLLWPYVNLSLLVIALGLRAGKTGADLANNPAKVKKPGWLRRQWNKLTAKDRPETKPPQDHGEGVGRSSARERSTTG